ncbi:hypothetical protein CEXT_206201 [Caerostris extrusa]|uniref:Uncharacterized protein n=1 Tax=Caerostris extrusa TaxID=172846 RepID=A0AAV4WZC8_CAEEX|nr:hypothetical protein CEXT_206201 [Caerostris extrusa]
MLCLAGLCVEKSKLWLPMNFDSFGVSSTVNRPVNLILAIVAMSYDELQKKAEEEEAAAAEEAAMQAEAAFGCSKKRRRESGRSMWSRVHLTCLALPMSCSWAKRKVARKEIRRRGQVSGVQKETVFTKKGTKSKAQ